jgi:flap endonuclease-1
MFPNHASLFAPELTKYLVDEMGFNADRVASSIAKLQGAYKTSKTPQQRLDTFFSIKSNPNAAVAAKRKVDEIKKGKATAAKSKKKR